MCLEKMLLVEVSPEEGEWLLLAVGTVELTLEHLLVLAAQKGTSAIRDFWDVRNGINKGLLAIRPKSSYQLCDF